MFNRKNSLIDKPRSHWISAVFLYIAAFINTLDGTIVNLGLPAIQRDFQTTDMMMQWVLVIYVLGFASGLLPFGRFGDVFGRSRLFLWGLIVFVLASIWCGLAQHINALVFARGIKGLAAAAMLPQVLAIIRATFPEKDISKAISYFTMVSGFGALAGPMIGGILIGLDLFDMGWRVIFLVNVPLGLIALIGVLMYLPKSTSYPDGQKLKADWVGAILFAGATATMLYPLIEGSSMGWPTWTIFIGALSILLSAAFVSLQYRKQRRGQSQLLPFQLLRNSQFLVGTGQVALLYVGVSGGILILIITLQLGFGLSATKAGVIMAAHPLGAMVASLISSRIGGNYLNLRNFIGSLLLLSGMCLLHLGFSDSIPGLELWAPLVLIGLGMGTVNVALFQSVLQGVSVKDAGAGAGALQAFQQIGNALGVALIGQVFFVFLAQSEDPNQYVMAIKTALWLPIMIYALLCVNFMKAIWKSNRSLGNATHARTE